MPHQPEIHRWYNRSEWQRRRRHQLRLQPLCETCLEAGRVTVATVADRIEPHRGNYELFRLGKLRSLCVECHDSLDARNRAPVRSRFAVRADGTPPTRGIRGTRARRGTSAGRSGRAETTATVARRSCACAVRRLLRLREMLLTRGLARYPVLDEPDDRREDRAGDAAAHRLADDRADIDGAGRSGEAEQLKRNAASRAA